MEIYIVNLLDDLERMNPDPLELTAFELWLLMSSVQHTYRNPMIGKELRHHLYTIGHLIQRQFDSSPALAVLAESGWHTEYDISSAHGRE